MTDPRLLNQAVQRIQAGDVDKPNAEIGQRGVDLVNELFQSLMAIKPAWRQMIPTDEALNVQKAMFVRGFKENGIKTAEQVALGVRKARKDPSDFFPSVGKFISWCTPKPEDFGLLPVEEAYREACMKSHNPSRAKWSHPAIYHAGRQTGWFELGSEPSTKTRPLFKIAYADICKRLMDGEQFEAPKADATRLEHHRRGKQVKTQESKAAGREALAGLKQSVGLR